MDPLESYLNANPWVPFVLFLLWWNFLLWIIGKISGWQQLAEKYPGDGRGDDPMVRWKWWQSVSMRARCNYNNCLILGVSPKGLALRMPLVFRFGHPPILLPWQAIESAEAGKSWWMDTIRLHLREPRMSLLFRAGALQDAQPWLIVKPAGPKA